MCDAAYALLCADAHAVDASVLPYMSKGDMTTRERLDDFLVSPLDPRQAAAEEAFVQNLMEG